MKLTFTTPHDLDMQNRLVQRLAQAATEVFERMLKNKNIRSVATIVKAKSITFLDQLYYFEDGNYQIAEKLMGDANKFYESGLSVLVGFEK